MFAGCARVYMVSFHGHYGTMTAEHAEPFWSFLVMSKVRPLNNKEKRNKDREALKVDGTKLQARHSCCEGTSMSKHRSATNKTETTHQRNQLLSEIGPVAQVPLTGDMFEFDGVFDMTSSQAAQPRSVRFPTSPVFRI